MIPATVTEWIDDLRSSDQEAARKLWDHYFQRLTAEARKWLHAGSTRTFSEEDVALSVFASFCRGVSEGQFDRVGNRDDLWRLLVVITHGKVVDRRRRAGRQKRGGGSITRGESVFLEGNMEERRRGLDSLVSDEPDPEFLATVSEEYKRLLRLLGNDVLRAIAQARMEGYSVEEIAKMQGISIRTVERKIHMIRERWFNEVLPEKDRR